MLEDLTIIYHFINMTYSNRKSGGATVRPFGGHGPTARGAGPSSGGAMFGTGCGPLGPELVYISPNPIPVGAQVNMIYRLFVVFRYIDPSYVIISWTSNTICPLIYYDHEFCH